MKSPRVTDHAVLRFLERCAGFDVEAIRKQIAERCHPAMQAGASTLKYENGKFVFNDTKDTVISFTPDKGMPCRTAQARIARNYARATNGVAS